MEKLCLINPRIGRDKISDFTTNFAKRFLLEYTEKFAKNYLSPSQCKYVSVNKAYFNWDTMTWVSKQYYLPFHNGDFVLLTPKSMLTRDDTFINRNDMIRNLHEIAPSIPDEALRFELNTYLQEVLLKKKKEMSQKEKDLAASRLIRSHPELIDYYIRHKEDTGDKAKSVSKEKVAEAKKCSFLRYPHLLIY